MRIKYFDNLITSTKKGFKNAWKSLWKKQERTENDGLKQNFKVTETN